MMPGAHYLRWGGYGGEGSIAKSAPSVLMDMAAKPAPIVANTRRPMVLRTALPARARPDARIWQSCRTSSIMEMKRMDSLRYTVISVIGKCVAVVTRRPDVPELQPDRAPNWPGRDGPPPARRTVSVPLGTPPAHRSPG